MSRILFATIDSPNPSPFPIFLLVVKGSKIVESASPSMPHPLSDIFTSSDVSLGTTEMVILGFGVCSKASMALETRLPRTCRSRCSSACIFVNLKEYALSRLSLTTAADKFVIPPVNPQ